MTPFRRQVDLVSQLPLAIRKVLRLDVHLTIVEQLRYRFDRFRPLSVGGLLTNLDQLVRLEPYQG